MQYCKITANLHALVPDTDDPDDFPDHRPLIGDILFEPVIPPGELIQHDNAGDLELLAITPITAEVKIDGRIHYEGNTWVKIPAPTLPDTNIETLQWKASFVNFFYDLTPVTINPILFNAIPDGEINLAAIPTVGGTPTVIIQSGPRGHSVISARNQAGYLILTFEGPDGPYDSEPVALPGGAGTIEILSATGTTAQILSGHRVVTVEDDGTVNYASCMNASDVNRPLWMTTGAWSAGVLGTFVTKGIVEEPTWNWTIGLPLFLADNGLLSQSIPGGAIFARQIATVASPTKINFDAQPAIVLV